MKIRFVKVVEGVGLYRSPPNPVYAGPLYVVYKAGGRVDTTTKSRRR